MVDTHSLILTSNSGGKWIIAVSKDGYLPLVQMVIPGEDVKDLFISKFSNSKSMEISMSFLAAENRALSQKTKSRLSWLARFLRKRRNLQINIVDDLPKIWEIIPNDTSFEHKKGQIINFFHSLGILKHRIKFVEKRGRFVENEDPEQKFNNLFQRKKRGKVFYKEVFL